MSMKKVAQVGINDTYRQGLVRIAMDSFADCPADLLPLMAQCVVHGVYPDGIDTGRRFYHIWSSKLDRVEPGEPLPVYLCTMRQYRAVGGGRVVTASFQRTDEAFDLAELDHLSYREMVAIGSATAKLSILDHPWFWIGFHFGIALQLTLSFALRGMLS